VTSMRVRERKFAIVSFVLFPAIHKLAIHKTESGPRPIAVIRRCYLVTPIDPLGSTNFSSATSHKPWRRRRPSALPAQCRSGGQS
jgi:hypothetical protein